MSRRTLGGIALCLCFAVASAQDASIPPIVELKVTPKESVFKNSAWRKPIVIKSGADAAAHFGQDALKTIVQKVDFTKQIVLVFAWQGSGGDKFEYAIRESFPEQIPFSLRRGLTDDIRTHSRVFAVRSNVRWSVKSK